MRFWKKFFQRIKLLLPAMLAIMLLILGLINFRVLGMHSFIPLFSTMVVYYWAIYWPDAMPKSFVLALGLIKDFLYGLPPGITSVLLLLLWWMMTVQRRYLIKEPFIIIWLFYVVSLAIYVTCSWLLNMLVMGQWFWDDAIAVQMAVSCAIYPLLHKLFNMIHSVLVGEGKN